MSNNTSPPSSQKPAASNGSSTKRPGVLRRGARAFLGRSWKRIGTEALAPPEHQLLKPSITATKDEFKRVIPIGNEAVRRIRHGREIQQMTYAEMLQRWGVEPAQVKQTIRRLRHGKWQAFGIAALGGVCAIWDLSLGLRASWSVLWCATLVALVCTSVGVVTAWRLDCLLVGRYEPISSWLRLRK